MKVKQMIENLSKFDPEMDVIILDGCTGWLASYPVMSVPEELNAIRPHKPTGAYGLVRDDQVEDGDTRVVVITDSL